MTHNDVVSCDVAVVRWGQTANTGHVPNNLMPNTFMAVAVDLGDPTAPMGDIHPRYKQQVGQRLATAGLAIAYKDQRVPYETTTGPLAVLARASKHDWQGLVVVHFNHTGGIPLQLRHAVGFEYSPNACNMKFPNAEPQGTWEVGMVVASDGATVTIETNGILALCVRYNWYNAACMPGTGPKMCAIYGKAASDQWLPALPFVMHTTLVPWPPSM